jgi:hypothetical protein
VRIRQSVPELQHSFEIQYGGRPPFWIPTMQISREISQQESFSAWRYMSIFMRIGRSVPELRHFFEIQYGGRSPSWIPEMYAFCQLALNRMPSYANLLKISCRSDSRY